MSARIHDWQADFAVFDHSGQLAVVAEAINKSGIDRQWASEWFCNFVSRQHSPAPPFVLLATPETLYIWKRSEKTSSREPTATVGARRVFASYLRNSGLEISNISGSTFESIVGAWLDAVSHGFWQALVPEERRLFGDSGLLEAVENGRVVSDVAA
ncbi:MAG: hypothetical protein QOC81_2685 [Thermoanaerobaculia bacterium]|jgi:hypothetical protein|nr:hypothetical protein [Thermoanaerobaculia bacterium]